MAVDEIRNFVAIDERTGLGGQPTAEQFEAIRADGYEVVVNLAPTSAGESSLSDEPGLLAALNLDYHHLPVVWDAPSVHDFAAFREVMDASGDRRVFVHCAMNFRVTAFYSLYAMQRKGWSAAQADALVDRVWGPVLDQYPVWRSFIEQTRETF